MRLTGMMGLYAPLSALASIGPLAFASAMAARRGALPAEMNPHEANLGPNHQGLPPETPAPSRAAASLATTQATLLERLPPGPVDIYDPGGGSVSFLPHILLDRAHVTVVDNDPRQIDRTRFAGKRIFGDVQRHWLAPASVDLVACCDVIQYLDDVESALIRFSEALRPGGHMLVAAPLPRSPSGLVARYGPHGVRVLFDRRAGGEADAEPHGDRPCRPRFHPLVAPERLKRYMAVRGFQTVYERVQESLAYATLRKQRPVLGTLVDGAAMLVNLSLVVSTDIRLGDYHLLLRKRAGDDRSKG